MTSFENKCAILADLWMDYRDDEEFKDFREYNDLGLPIAYALDHNIVGRQPMAEQFVDETFELLLAALEISEDTGFETLDDLLGSSL